MFGENKVKLPEGKAMRPEIVENISKEVVMGIRPEHLHDEESTLHSS